MTSLLAIFGFLAAVLYEGHSLTCEKCLAYGSTICKGSTEMCGEADDKCIQMVETNTLDDDMRLTTFKGCHPRDMPQVSCDVSDHSFSCSRLHIRVVTNCGPHLDTLSVPPLNLTANGYMCPDCFTEGPVDDGSKEECKTGKMIECRGHETVCLKFNGVASRPLSGARTYGFQGCITQGACALMPFMPGTKANPSRAQYSCTPASKD